MKYLFNGRGLYYPIKSYSKKRDIITLEDPHTGETFQLANAEETIQVAGYKVVRDED